MKNIIFLTISLFISTLSFSQKRNIEFTIKTGAVHYEPNHIGVQISPQLNYYFFLSERIHIGAGILFNSYRISYEDNFTVSLPGEVFTQKNITTESRKYIGFQVGMEARLFSLEKNIVPFIQPQVLFLNEMGREDFGGTFGSITNNQRDIRNSFNLNLTSGIVINNRIKFGLYYERTLRDTKNTYPLTPNYMVGASLSYLFNISFKKTEVVE